MRFLRHALVGSIFFGMVSAGQPAMGQPAPSGAGDGATAVDADSESAPVSTRRQTELLRWRQTFFWGIVLLIIFLISAGVIIRFSLRYRKYLLSGKSAPTPTEDVWKMHKVPKDELDEPGPDEPGDDKPS